MPILGAAAYTGVFLVTVSNLSYQLLQGVLEPRIIEPIAGKVERSLPPAFGGTLRWTLIAAARAGRSVCVSGLAIRGMQVTGLQQRA